MVEPEFFLLVNLTDPMHVVPLEKAVGMVFEQHYLEKCVANRVHMVEIQVGKIVPILATSGMDLDVKPLVIVVLLSPKTIDLNVLHWLVVMITNLNAVEVEWTVDPMWYHKIVYVSITK